MYQTQTTTRRTMQSIKKHTRSGRPQKFGVVSLATLLIVTVGCGGEARSESQIPRSESQIPDGAKAVEAPAAPELTERSDPEDPATESRWVPAAYVADQTAATVDEPEAEPVAKAVPAAQVEPEPAPRRSEPVLVATDTGEGQMMDFEPSTQAANEAEGEVEAPVEPLDTVVNERPEVPPLRVEAGAELVFTVEADLSTQDNRPGDVFYAYLTDDLMAADGLVLLPRGVRARGRVVETLASEDSEEVPVLEVVLEELIGPEGDTPIVAIVVDAEMEADPRDSDGESVVKVLTGAAAGAILGRILGGDDEDAVKGGLAGAAAGAAVAYGTRGGHAKLPAGGQLTIRLEQPLTVF